MSFKSCFSDSSSDFVSRSETKEVLGLAPGKGFGLDAEELADFVSMAGLEFFVTSTPRHDITLVSFQHSNAFKLHALKSKRLSASGPQFRRDAIRKSAISESPKLSPYRPVTVDTSIVRRTQGKLRDDVESGIGQSSSSQSNTAVAAVLDFPVTD